MLEWLWLHLGLALLWWQLGVTLLWLILVAWGTVEAARIRHWKWAATIVLVPTAGVLAWFVTGRRRYGYPRLGAFFLSRPRRPHGATDC